MLGFTVAALGSCSAANLRTRITVSYDASFWDDMHRQSEEAAILRIREDERRRNPSVSHSKD